MKYLKDSLGNRMKGYEDVYRLYLPKRLPLILRCDGIAFHTYTRKCKRPFDENLISVMNEAAIAICKEAQGARLAYVQSDEITVLIYEPDFEAEPWFNNNINKILSASATCIASSVSLASKRIFGTSKKAKFDARVFPLPFDEVVNEFIWRQADCTRNSVQMYARSLYSHKELKEKKNKELQEMLFKKGINWNNIPIYQKRGRCVIKKDEPKTVIRNGKTIISDRSSWVVDEHIPIFSKNRDYIESRLYDISYFEKIKEEYLRLLPIFETKK